MQFAKDLAQKAQSWTAASLDPNKLQSASKSATDAQSSSSASQKDDTATAEAPARRRSTLYRRARGVGAAAVFVGCLVGAAVHRAKQVKISHVHETMADMASAREAGEALAAAGDTRGARELLGAAVSRWTSHERTVRYAIWTRTQLPSNSDDENAPERLAAVFEDAQHVASHLRAAYGSLLVEDNRPKEAVSHLTAVCPSIWFFSRRNGPGAEHLRGEVSWLRCYADLMDARKMLGQSDEVGVLERDVVTHSTAWLRRKRDRRPISRAESYLENAATSAESKRGALLLSRRRHDLEARWPRDAPRLRRGWGSGAGPPPKNLMRRERNRKRVATLRHLSTLSAMDAQERADTSQDYARALGRARAARRDVDGVVRAYVDAPDALQRTRLLALLRETAGTAAARALPSDEAPLAAPQDKDAAAEWSAGVALAAMLRAAAPDKIAELSQAERPKDAVDASAAYLALADAFFGEKGAAAAAAAAAATAAAEAPKVVAEPVAEQVEEEAPVTRAFGRLVAAEGAQYVAVVSEVHAKGWAWIQHEVARLEEDQRRCGLAIAPVAGPPPGFLSRFDVIHVVAQHRAAVVQRDQRAGRRPGLVPPRKRATGQKTRRQRARERNAKVYGGLLVLVVALVRGLALLKDTRRKTADGYSKRRPKLTWRTYGEALLQDVLQALRLCVTDLLKTLRSSLKRADASLGAGAAVLRAVDTVTSIVSPDADDESDGEEEPASSDEEVKVAPKKPAKQKSGGKLRRRAPAKPKTPEPAKPVILPKELEKMASFDDSEDDWAASTEWLPVPKGGRVVGEGPRVLEVSPRHHVVTPPLAPPSRGGSPNQGRKEGLVVQSLLDQRLSQQKRSDREDVCPSVTSTSSSGSSGAKPPPRKKVVSPRGSPQGASPRRSRKAHRKAPPLPRLDSGGSLARAVATSSIESPTGYGIWDDATAAAAAANAAAPPARQVSTDGLDEALRQQVEYYFSVANLCKDVYLRGCMDGQGFVPLDHVCTFKRLRDLCDDTMIVQNAVKSSDKLNLVRFTDESSGANVWKVRTNEQPERWVLAASQP